MAEGNPVELPTADGKLTDAKSESACCSTGIRHHTQTISMIKQSKGRSTGAPYIKPLKALVLGTEKQEGNQHVVLADESGYIKLINKREDLFHKFSGSVVIRDYSQGHSCLFSTTNTAVAPAKSVLVPEDVKQNAMQLIKPKEPEMVI